MAFKLPKPDQLKKTDKAMPAGKTGRFSLAGLFGGGKKTPVPLAAGSKMPTAGNRTSQPGPATNSGFGATGGQTQKIAAAVAANKVTKTKKNDGGFKLPLIGNRPLEKQLPVLLFIFGIFLLLAIAAAYFDARTRSFNATYTNITSQLQFHTQRLAKSAGLAARGDSISFPQLQDSRDEFQRYLGTLLFYRLKH